MKVIAKLTGIFITIFADFLYNRVFPHQSYLISSWGVQIVGGS